MLVFPRQQRELLTRLPGSVSSIHSHFSGSAGTEKPWLRFCRGLSCVMVQTGGRPLWRHLAHPIREKLLLKAPAAAWSLWLDEPNAFKERRAKLAIKHFNSSAARCSCAVSSYTMNGLLFQQGMLGDELTYYLCGPVDQPGRNHPSGVVKVIQENWNQQNKHTFFYFYFFHRDRKSVV